MLKILLILILIINKLNFRIIIIGCVWFIYNINKIFVILFSRLATKDLLVILSSGCVDISDSKMSGTIKSLIWSGYPGIIFFFLKNNTLYICMILLNICRVAFILSFRNIK